ncbi:MAG TPA: V-type ATP synthase subunit D [Rhabdochlamydiaceae bacterium]|nr:V-type ATP synthase subunit D [Rhabdochlamydiaceae bacterium]
MIKLTKTELRSQQVRLNQLQKYLPTLQLKKMLLQIEVNQAEQEIERFQLEFNAAEKIVKGYASLFSDRTAFDLFPSVKVIDIVKQFENIAGVDIPSLDRIVFQEDNYLLFDSPVWLDSAIAGLKNLIIIREKIRIAEEKKAALEKELREVSIRVNLFEKILIPRSQQNIRKIRIFLGDQQLAAVCQAKVAKQKILQREEAMA